MKGCMLTYLWKKLSNHIKERENEQKRKRNCSKIYPDSQGIKWYSFNFWLLLLQSEILKRRHLQKANWQIELSMEWIF